ncbi:stage II sporulation protein P [Romboutsia weinsteinii]|uniref:Stage II sporulation protein P n=1 Tax=Romboutsia weinsteinii TaxID=2020949 RepID=A0A371JAK8_9FIRM|nr:stage II sporulation protein P [Romboutsia weinsteinii]RDY29688.1 stage II sporulation protein P [Romboutsia weinsteinii]
MLKKRIKAIVMACVLVCILPTISLAIDKEEFLKFLIDSSYPETKVEEDKKASEKNDKEGSKKESSEVKKDYLEVYVGEENVPDISNTNKTTEVFNSSDYVNDLRVTKSQPRMLIYHTHGCETYVESPEGNYHSQDKANSVMSVGSLLTSELTNKGWGVVHSTNYSDYPEYNGAYSRSLASIQSIMPKYNSIDIAIDLHRDARDLDSEEVKKSEHDKFTTTIDGQKAAKFFFVVGERNENVAQINKLAQSITDFAQSKYPGLVSPVVKKKTGKYNQFVAKNHMLIEIGSNANSIEEAKVTAKYVATILDEYFKQQ